MKPGYFGYDRETSDLSDDEIVPTPVGAKCFYCTEEIKEGDAGLVMVSGQVEHRECGFRAVVGSLAHLKKECSCFVPGATETDPEGMTRREAAVAAWDYALEHGF